MPAFGARTRRTPGASVTLAPGTAGSEVVVRSFIKFDFCWAAASVNSVPF
jgi:hypothetical protein